MSRSSVPVSVRTLIASSALSVSFNFECTGVIRIKKSDCDENDLFMMSIEAGAEEFDSNEEFFILVTDQQNLYDVKNKLNESGVEDESCNIEMIPKLFISCNKDQFESNMKLIEGLEDLDDVDSVYHNMELVD